VLLLGYITKQDAFGAADNGDKDVDYLPV